MYVDQAAHLPDAVRIKQNIRDGHITVIETNIRTTKGEDAALRLYQGGGFDAVATDLFLAQQYRAGRLTIRDVAHRMELPLSEAMDALQRLGITGNTGMGDPYAPPNC